MSQILSDVKATFYARKVIASSSTPANNFQLETGEYDMGATQINPDGEEILMTWLAVGD